VRKFAFFAAVFAFSLLANLASAQQGDVALGFGTILAPSSSSSACPVFSTTCVGPEKGALYPTISADVIFHRRIGFNFEASWRGKQGLDNANGGQLYRPILFDFNGVYQPKINKKAGLDLMAGIGWQSTRFYGYQPTGNCLYFGACYLSSNHFLVDIGAGLRYYVWGHVFVRPEVRYYDVINNTVDFTSSNVLHLGASIGYTIGPD